MKTCSKCNLTKELTNFSKRKERKSGYVSRCKQCVNLYNKNYYLRPGVKEKLLSNHRKYRKDPKFKQNESIYRKKYEKERLKTDILFKLRKNLRSRINKSLKSSSINKQTSSTLWLGCDINGLKLHLEKQFKSGMTWDNHGDWHIDHIIPLSSATSEEDMYKLCHYTNLQPLWAIDNIKKGAK